ncbi:MAG: O-antigen ligase family protein [Clostridiales bacterium]|nr:O-antigen ligase family protein [Clostridiales bacterium]
MKEQFDKIVNSKFGRTADKLCNSVWYIIAYGVVCVLSHTLEIPVIGAVLLVLLLVPALLFCKNSFVLMPFLMMCAFVMSESTNPETGYYNTPLRISVLCIVLVIAVAAVVFNILYYKKWKQIYKRAYFTVSLALMYGALIIGGMGSSFFTVSGFTMSLAIAAATILPYALLVNCGEYEGRKTVEYFGWALIVAAMVISIDFFHKFIINDFNLQVWVVKEFLKLGFVGPNTGASVVTMAIPMTFYFVYKYKKGYWLVPLVAVELFTVVASYSRASLVVAAPITVAIAIFLCFKKTEGRRGYLIMFALSALAAIVIAIVLRHWIWNKLVELFSGNVTGSGRTTLWKTGFNAWCKSPIFGIGLWFLRLNDAHWYYSFHCTPLTYLYCGGILALAGYIYHRYRTVRLTFSAKLTVERVFVALCGLTMICNALLDTAMTAATHLIHYAIILVLIECDVKATKSNQTDIKDVIDADNTVEEQNIQTEPEGDIQ